MPNRGVHLSEDVSAAQWIGPKLEGPFGAVTRTVPAGYPAYARVCHPAEDGEGGWVTWSQVAEATGRQPHPVMQWHALVGSPDPSYPRDSLWPGNEPRLGHLIPAALSPLCDILARHTATPRSCLFCLWDGWGWIGGSPSVAVLGSDQVIPPAFPAELMSVPRVRHPGRDYFLFTGPLDAASHFGWRPRPDHFEPQSPNIIWPSDRAWYVATEIDFDSTLVGGTAELINAILTEPALDAWPVNSDDSLAADADHINLVR